MLLKEESENWSKIKNLNEVLMKKGFFISIPEAVIVFNKMEKIMENIIKIEQDIIDIEFS